MLSTILAPLALAALAILPQQVASQAVHGSSESGKMGPVAFLWPADRAWDADHDNTAPCGSTAGVLNRTDFPLGGGGVELTIKDDSWDVKISVAVSNDPKIQTEFDPVVNNVPSVEPGHQCYKFPTLPVDIQEGQNATIQLQYTSLDNGKKDTFYACADITFVATRAFTQTVPCFNVKGSDFTAVVNNSSTPTTSSTVAPPAPAAPTSAPTPASASPSASATPQNNAAGMVMAKGMSGMLVAAMAVAMVMM